MEIEYEGNPKRGLAILIIIIVSLLIGFICCIGMSCNYFQTRQYTDKHDRQARLYELCLKSASDAKQSGGNTLHCQSLQDDLTTAGRIKNYQDCFNFYQANKDRLTGTEFNCDKIIFPVEDK